MPNPEAIELIIRMNNLLSSEPRELFYWPNVETWKKEIRETILFIKQREKL